MRTAFWRHPDFFLYWLPPLVWGGAILVMSGDLCSSPNTLMLLKWVLSWFPPLTPGQIAAIHFYLRKTGHAVAYAILALLWLRALRGSLGLSPKRSFSLTLGFCLIFAALDEGHQYFLPSRTGSLWDVALDLSGSGLVALLTLAAGRPRPKTLAP